MELTAEVTHGSPEDERLAVLQSPRHLDTFPLRCNNKPLFEGSRQVPDMTSRQRCAVDLCTHVVAWRPD